MKSSTICLALLIAVFGSSVFGGMITVDWTSAGSRSAIGTLDGTTLAVATSQDAEFTLAFQPFDEANWQTDAPLAQNTELLGVANANTGDSHTFVFTEPQHNLMMYIENFDSSSEAAITVEGMDLGGVELYAGSPSISLEAMGMSTATLRTANETSDGEGDAILMFMGAVRSVSLDYLSGNGANGVFYTLAVPEPTASKLGLLGLAVALAFRRRRGD